MNAAIITLGCRLNQADTALISARLENSGYTVVPPDFDRIDLIVINSCAVTQSAVSKSRQALSKYRKLHPEARFIFTGCAADFSPKPDGVELVANHRKSAIGGGGARISGGVFREDATARFPFRHRALVKIQEGCDNFCTYCIVPHVRGRERSRSAPEVLAECRALLASGVPELVLTGVNTCAYSADGLDLGGLLKKICALEGNFRVRLSSTEPKMDNLALLESMAECGSRVCRFLHLSLQHGSDRILSLMNRHYTSHEYANFASAARKLFPDLHLGTDVIVGFPGETEADFEASRRFIEEMNFANIHIFSYSRRPGTPAAEFPDQVPSALIKERHAELAKIAETSAQKFRNSLNGKVLPVIFEEEKSNLIHGWSDNYVPVTAPVGAYRLGKIVQVEYRN